MPPEGIQVDRQGVIVAATSTAAWLAADLVMGLLGTSIVRCPGALEPACTFLVELCAVEVFAAELCELFDAESLDEESCEPSSLVKSDFVATKVRAL